MPYRFAGKVALDGKLQVFLSKKNIAIPIAEGATLEDGYRVESIEADRVTLVYVALNHRESIAFSAPAQGAGIKTSPSPVPAGTAPVAVSTAPRSGPQTPIAAIPTAAVIGAAAPEHATRKSAISEQKIDSSRARLLWAGPARVKRGDQFSVALRLTSGEPVHSLPMQVRFDPTILQAVAIKPGRFLGSGDRNFNYRVNADGSIFIGASNSSSAPASDAELLVLTFRAIKPASNAELSITSANLQGAGGRMIAFDSLTAFNTAIVP